MKVYKFFIDSDNFIKPCNPNKTYGILDSAYIRIQGKFGNYYATSPYKYKGQQIIDLTEVTGSSIKEVRYKVVVSLENIVDENASSSDWSC